MNFSTWVYWLMILAVSSIICMSCQANNDTPSSSEETNQAQENVLPEGPMTIEGIVVEIMETWPLQLIVETENGNVQVELLEETTVTEGEQGITPADLQIGQRLRIEGDGVNNAIQARSIDMLPQE